MWTASVDGKINLVVRYGSKPLEFAKGKNAIELASESEMADTLRTLREAAELGELDVLIEQQAQFGTEEQVNRRRCIFQHDLHRRMCKYRLRKLLNCNRYVSVEKTCTAIDELHTCYTRAIRRL